MGCPRCKLRETSEETISIGKITLIAQAGAKPNLLRNFEGSLRPAASGLRCWGNFRDATDRPRFPIIGEGDSS